MLKRLKQPNINPSYISKNTKLNKLILLIESEIKLGKVSKKFYTAETFLESLKK
jgi:hypothetical protein